MFSAEITEAARALLVTCRTRGLRIATAESCTGGLIAAALTAIPGSSDVFERGFVTYSNEAKTEMLGVPAALIERYGAVSAEVAHAMAEGALAHSRADIAVAVTGVAGPGGGSAAKPVGLVHIVATRREGARRHEECRFGDAGRDAVRVGSVLRALDLLERIARLPPSPSSLGGKGQGEGGALAHSGYSAGGPYSCTTPNASAAPSPCPLPPFGGRGFIWT